MRAATTNKQATDADDSAHLEALLHDTGNVDGKVEPRVAAHEGHGQMRMLHGAVHTQHMRIVLQKISERSAHVQRTDVDKCTRR